MRCPGCSVSFAIAWSSTYLLLANSSNAANPSAISAPVRAYWKGYDGFWSPLSIRVGTPPQGVDVFISTASQETWVVGTSGCDGSEMCLDARGGVFASNTSSSWVAQGSYFLGLDPQLGFSGKGIYGFDSIAMETVNRVNVSSQLVGVINSTNYWLGFFGLGVRPTNLTSNDQKTFLSSMVEDQGLIPTHSYGYTAGAHHRLKGVTGSLTLGGYDANRFIPHDVSFNLDPDLTPVVAINSIKATAAPLSTSNTSIGWKDNSIDLLQPTQADIFAIDSSTPYLWLPESVCQQFEKALGLTYDDGLELYTFAQNQSQHQQLQDWNITFQFTIADLPGSTKVVSLDLPYDAFDLQLSYPYPGLNITATDPSVPYFPLRKAANSTQYTVGRAFLQEAYLIVDYERNNFSVHSVNFAPDALSQAHLVDITRPKNSTFAVKQVAPILSKGGIAGIIVAAIFGLCLLIGLVALIVKMRRDPTNGGYEKDKGELTRESSGSRHRFVQHFLRLPRKSQEFERESQHDVPELQGGEEISSTNSELDGSNHTIRGFYERDLADEKPPPIVVNAIGHDPSMPVELPYRSSNYQPGNKEQPIPELSPASATSSRSELSAFRSNDHRLFRQDTGKSAAVSSPSDEGNSKAPSDPFRIVSPVSPDAQDEVSSLETIARRAAWYVSAESESVSSQSHGGTVRSMRSNYSLMNIDERAGFAPRHSRQTTVSSMGRSTTPGTPSANNTVSYHGTPQSYSKVPRNSRATGLDRAESSTASSGLRSQSSTVTNDIRRSVQRGFSWIQTNSEDTPQRSTRPTTVDEAIEQSPYSPARWIEFWRTGRDPRLGPVSNDRTPQIGADNEPHAK
ncbi:uncharacterized protein KY384_007800 [Bacidia gigantensis]|uniref:uncharacterized protein n=1 Tax=Bacidia gigantensis TaxID=2732470 RepID=UPI001D05BF1B|nr:uncharacterized protein KY384_007800 [Bacidia gigantensis]KAG8527647.1 hypothetical protein KY384_007800 [Bacidia gigantensis]